MIAEAGDAVLAPAVGAAARVVVGKVFPGIAVRAVVLPDRAPLPFAEIGAPFAPGAMGLLVAEAKAFGPGIA